MHKHIETFGVLDVLKPGLLLTCIGIVVLYYALIGPWRHRFAEAKPVSGKQKFYFLMGVLLLYIGQGPIGFFGHHFFFSAHMTNMAIVYLAVPPLILLGMPVWFLRAILRPVVVKKIFLFFTSPLIALVLFNGLLSFYHLPSIFDTVMNNVLYHYISHYMLLSTAFFMWWPVVSPLPEYDRLSSLQKLAYIFAAGVLITPACVLIIFANKMLFQTYLHSILLGVWMTPLNDQQLGGVMMKILQEIIYGVALYNVFYRWYRYEREKEASEEQNMQLDLAIQAPGKPVR